MAGRASTPAIALLLVVRDSQPLEELLAQGGDRYRASHPTWVSPSVARGLYVISEDTWTRGVRELSDVGILQVGRRSVGGDFERRRMRNVWTLKLGRLTEPIGPG